MEALVHLRFRACGEHGQGDRPPARPAGGGCDVAVHRVRCRRARFAGMTTYMRRRYAEPAGRDRFDLVCQARAAQRLNTQCKLLLLTHAFEKARLHCGRIPHALLQSPKAARHRTIGGQAGLHPAQPPVCAERHTARHCGLQYHLAARPARTVKGAFELSTERKAARLTLKAKCERRNVPVRVKQTRQPENARRQETSEGKMETFDYVIVGAELCGKRAHQPLERTPPAPASPCSKQVPATGIPTFICRQAKTFHMKSINWAYQQEPGPYTGGRSIYAPRGADARRLVLDQRPYL